MTEPLSERFAVLVHEVRSPVAALTAVAGTVADTRDPAARRELIGLALAASAAIERIVSDVAVASVRPVAVDVGALVRDVVAARAVSGVDIEALVEPGVPLVEADPVRLRQAIDNLVTNALVHGGGGVAVRVAPAEGGVRVSVADHGRGISAEHLERVFERGVRLDDDVPGTGLGLAVTKAIVDAHRGTITVESTPGTGSTFTITLPARSQPDT